MVEVVAVMILPRSQLGISADSWISEVRAEVVEDEELDAEVLKGVAVILTPSQPCPLSDQYSPKSVVPQGHLPKAGEYHR